jgi:hypothetical protein
MVAPHSLVSIGIQCQLLLTALRQSVGRCWSAAFVSTMPGSMAIATHVCEAFQLQIRYHFCHPGRCGALPAQQPAPKAAASLAPMQTAPTQTAAAAASPTGPAQARMAPVAQKQQRVGLRPAGGCWQCHTSKQQSASVAPAVMAVLTAAAVATAGLTAAGAVYEAGSCWVLLSWRRRRQQRTPTSRCPQRWYSDHLCCLQGSSQRHPPGKAAPHCHGSGVAAVMMHV